MLTLVETCLVRCQKADAAGEEGWRNVLPEDPHRRSKYAEASNSARIVPCFAAFHRNGDHDFIAVLCQSALRCVRVGGEGKAGERKRKDRRKGGERDRGVRGIRAWSL